MRTEASHGGKMAVRHRSPRRMEVRLRRSRRLRELVGQGLGAVRMDGEDRFRAHEGRTLSVRWVCLFLCALVGCQLGLPRAFVHCCLYCRFLNVSFRLGLFACSLPVLGAGAK